MTITSFAQRLVLAVLTGGATAVAAAGGPQLMVSATESTASLTDQPAIEFADQLPDSRVARTSPADRRIALAYLAEPTARYRHAVLGDGLEAGALVLGLRDGRMIRLQLPERRVFEDLSTRLIDLDGDGQSEVVVVESDIADGASLAVYGLRDKQLTVLARGPFIGTAHRWLNPLGAGDFDGDGKIDLAAVATPHIGGILQLYRYQSGQLVPLADTTGVSTHRYGTKALGLGAVVRHRNRPAGDWLLVPDNSHRHLRLLALRDRKLVELTRVELESPLAGDLIESGSLRWQTTLASGKSVSITVRP